MSDKASIQGILTVPVFLMLLFFIIPTTLLSHQLSVLKADGLNIYFDEPLAPAAHEIAKIYPSVKSELESALMWKVDFRPNVLLIPDQETFSMLAGNSMIVAYAIPEKMLIVIDYSRMTKEPFLLAVTLKHELCHLLLHSSIQKSRLPRWLDEGVCQWVSGGFTELIMGRNHPSLAWAALSGRLFKLDSLALNFPEDDQSISLAYEESRSITDYIAGNFGRNGILNLLQALKDGHEIKDAVPISIGISLGDLEQKWRASQKSAMVLISYLAGDLYTMLFIVAALLTIAIYVRILIRKRRFKDEEPSPEGHSGTDY
jgi:hypothetical protein